MTEYSLESVHHLLRDRFGHTELRPGQQDLIEAVLAGRDALGVMPTGGGKSLCYQLPSQILEGATVVVSPLISLMKDQVDALRARGIQNVASLNSTSPPHHVPRIINAFREGRLSLLYVAPERATTAEFHALVKDSPVALFVVDEAHCVSQWGHDFRPDYRKLGELFMAHEKVPVLALTATATPRVREDIIESLPLRHPEQVVLSFDRPNIFFSVRPTKKEDKDEEVLQILRRNPGSAIVYVSRRKDTELLARTLNGQKITAAPYHAGMTDAARHEVQEGFQSGKYRVIVATIAFGMGIDKPDIRSVIHYHLSDSLESYYQEIGRAGRDGDPAQAVLLFNKKDASIKRFLINDSYPSTKLITAFYIALRKGETLEEVRGNYRIGDSGVNTVLQVLQEAGVAELDPHSGELTVVDRGYVEFDLGEREKRREASLERLDDMVRYAQKRACRRGALLRYFGEEPEAKTAGACCDVCNGDVAGAASSAEGRILPRRRAPKTIEVADLEDTGLGRQLKQWRRKKATERGLPAFMIASNRTLDEIVKMEPKNESALRRVNGVGDAFMEKYGDEILDLIRNKNKAAAAEEEEEEEEAEASGQATPSLEPVAGGSASGSRYEPVEADHAPAHTEPEVRHLTEDEEDIARVILGAVESLSGKGGRVLLGKVLAGSRAKEIQRAPFNNPEWYGALAQVGQRRVVDAIDRLLESGHLAIEPGIFPTVVFVHREPPFPDLGLTRRKAPRSAGMDATGADAAGAPEGLPDGQVPRQVGLLILDVVHEADGEFDAAMVAAILLGAAPQETQMAEIVEEFSSFGALAGQDFEELRDHVLRMARKGYLELRGKGRKLSLSLKGQKALAGSPQHRGAGQ